MGRLPKPKITKHSYFGAAGDIYNCPTIASIDRHVIALTERIHTCSPWRAATLKALQEDRDMLLDLRWAKAKRQRVTSH
jgi:hypothetical protein